MRINVLLEWGEDGYIMAHRPALKNGFGLPESSVRSGMFIADERQNIIQAPSGAACSGLNAWPRLCL
jgi:hypothetical protein